MKLNFHQQGRGPAVILLHGLFGSSSNLTKAAKALYDDFSVYQVDLRNHGLSPHCADMDYPSMAADIIELMNDQGIEYTNLLGHSMGGKIAMQIALNYAERVKKLIVADIAPVTYPRHHNPVLEGLLALENSNLQSRQQADEKLSEFVLETQVRAFLLKNLFKKQDGNYGLRLNIEAIVNHYEALGQAPTGTPFHGPTLFLKGLDSAYIQTKHRDEVLTLFPAAKMQVISGAGHWLHSDKPDTFNRLIRQFLIKP